VVVPVFFGKVRHRLWLALQAWRWAGWANGSTRALDGTRWPPVAEVLLVRGVLVPWLLRRALIHAG
jgi:hypothetical protein